MGRVIGIDLGTTTSEIAYIENGKPKLIPDIYGDTIIPSIVAEKENEIIVGRMAYNQLLSNPEKTISEIKCLIGSKERIKLGNQRYLPHEISSIILQELKSYAEKFIGEEVEEAIITVPANFDSKQRELTKLAGEVAGFKVERIINEPTAAAIGYGIDNLQKNEKLLVYDLGGGTFDVTILEMVDGVLDVVSSRGNNKLGGKNFDERIERYIDEEFKEQYGVYLSETDVDYTKIKPRLKEAAINAKKELSSNLRTIINIPFITSINNKNVDFNIELSRAKFDEITLDLVNSTTDTINEVLKAAKCSEDDIDIVLLVGGASRIVSVQNLLYKLFQKKVKLGINPDELVALGAAVQAGIKNNEIRKEKAITVKDKCSYNLGTRIVGEVDGQLVDGLFDCLIPIDSALPSSYKKIYKTVYDNQKSIAVDVYEGNEPLVHDNTKVGYFILQGIPEGPAGSEEIEIEFNYDLNGILQVNAKVLSTGEEVRKVINRLQYK